MIPLHTRYARGGGMKDVDALPPCLIPTIGALSQRRRIGRGERSHFGLRFASDSIEPVTRQRGRFVENKGSPMGTPLDELFDCLSRLLEEPATAFHDRLRRHGRDDDILALLEANARLRALAIQLSNLVGDLPPFQK